MAVFTPTVAHLPPIPEPVYEITKRKITPPTLTVAGQKNRAPNFWIAYDNPSPVDIGNASFELMPYVQCIKKIRALMLRAGLSEYLPVTVGPEAANGPSFPTYPARSH